MWHPVRVYLFACVGLASVCMRLPQMVTPFYDSLRQKDESQQAFGSKTVLRQATIKRIASDIDMNLHIHLGRGTRATVVRVEHTAPFA